MLLVRLNQIQKLPLNRFLFILILSERCHRSVSLLTELRIVFGKLIPQVLCLEPPDELRFPIFGESEGRI